jgi:hypothetical protein
MGYKDIPGVTAADVTVDTSTFDTNLSSADNTAQKALATLDDVAGDFIKLATGSFGIGIDGGTTAISTGSKGFIVVPYACTIKAWTILANEEGSIVVDVKKSSYANFPTTASIAASAKPTLDSAQKNTDTTLTDWTISVSAGDVIEFVVDSATTVTRVNLIITVQKV